jgi:hypothetical protein
MSAIRTVVADIPCQSSLGAFKKLKFMLQIILMATRYFPSASSGDSSQRRMVRSLDLSGISEVIPNAVAHVKSADPLRRYIPPFIFVSSHYHNRDLAIGPISVCPDISTISQYHIANLSSIFVQLISLKISFRSIKAHVFS